MEDPWASGTSWGETPKPTILPQSPTLPKHTSSIADPWGAPTASPESNASDEHEARWNNRSKPDQDSARKASTATPGWGGGWDEQPEAGPSRSPIRRPADSPEWLASEPRSEETENARISPSNIDLEEPVALPTTSPLDESSTLSTGFAYTAPSPPIPIAESVDINPPSLPTSPTFGDEFGGFASFGDDPWGPKKQDSGWEGKGFQSAALEGTEEQSADGEGWGGDGHHHDRSQSESPPPGTGEEWEADETASEIMDNPQQDSWGGDQSPVRLEKKVVAQAGMDQEWEEAQKRIRITEQRAPRERVMHLQEGWRDLVQGVIGEKQLAERAEEAENTFERALQLQEDNTRETLRSLSTIPPDTNTYPPVLTSMETHERYRYALSRPNPNPETSLLNIPLSRRARQNENLADSLDSWTSRSRLGEPETLPIESSLQAEDAKPKWSFWRKNTAEKPLVTSGGGLLEAKTISSSSTPAPIESRPSVSSATSASIATNTSRPASPAPPFVPGVIPTADMSPNVPPLVASPDPAVPAQSAVTRFFGRLSRRQTAQPNLEDDDNKDLALSADDFSFLDQVPSIASPNHSQNVGDLLTYEGGRTESMASLESMLNSKPTPLPAALAPPPAWSGASSTSGRPNRQHKQVDLLEGLDFGDDMGTLSTPFEKRASAQTAGSTTSAGNWDQLFTTSTSSTNTSVPTSAVPMISSPPTAGPSSRPLQSHQPSNSSGMGDFDDFDDFAPATTSPGNKSDGFDDFGDFGSFSTPPPPAVQPRPYLTPASAISSFKAPPSTGHVKRASLDHTPTLNLINDASAVKGKRWPAPPSPLAPQLDPPPKGTHTSTSFPFISPPPGGGRPNSGFGDLLDDGAKMTNAIDHSSPPSRVRSPPIAPSLPMMPTRTASPVSRPPSTMGPAPNNIAKQASQPRQTGLSAQDLSFFDSL